ncbi:MAG: hypothetical protein ACK5B9_16500 [Flavobacteriia bacterium]|jgi:hypothetical protein
MKSRFLYFLFLSVLVASCSLSASQEQELNKQMGLFLDAKEKNTVLLIVSKTHPSYVKYAKSKGNFYFKEAFQEKDVEDLVYIDPIILQIESEGDKIHVLYEIEREYILNGENKEEKIKIVALSEDDGVNWYFLNYGAYMNKNICKDITRLLK